MPVAARPRATLCLAALAAAVLTIAPPRPALAVFSGDMSPRAESGDADYAAAIRARKAKDWPTMVAALEKVVARRPWHDNAHNLLGYGLRQLGDYERALVHYETAIRLNPRHRQAMSYMAQAYLHLDRIEDALAMMERLGEVCTEVALTFSDGDFTDGCEEYRDLRVIVAFFMQNDRMPTEAEAPGDW